VSGRSRINVMVKPAPSGKGGRSNLARYMARSKLDHQREGHNPRALFSTNRDQLSYWEAEQLISRGKGVPHKEDVKHIVISLRMKDYELLGGNDEERRPHMIKIAERAIDLIAQEKNISHLSWYGAIHLNTDNPHIHIGIGKNVINRETGRPERLEHIPESLLQRNKVKENSQEIQIGKIAEMVRDKLDQIHRERIKQLEINDHSNPSRHRKILRELVPLQILRQRAPTEEERLVGRWFLSEYRAALQSENPRPGNSNEQPGTKELKQLRKDVSRLDSIRQEHGLNQIPAYIDSEDLSYLLHNVTKKVNVQAYLDPSKTDILQRGGEYDPKWWDSYYLGRSMVFRGKMHHLSHDLDNMKEHGDKRRWTVHDSHHNRSRRISEFDLKKRAEIFTKVELNSQPILDSHSRQEFKQDIFTKNIDDVHAAIKAQQLRKSHVISKLSMQLNKVQEDYEKINPFVTEIKDRYKANGEQLPVPLVTKDEINELQDLAILTRDSKRVRIYENIRQCLAQDNDIPSRTDFESGRLRMQLREVETELPVHGRRIENFNRNYHYHPWEIDGKQWSLSSVHKEIGRRQYLGSFAHLGLGSLLPSVREEKRTELDSLELIREQILNNIEDYREELSKNYDRVKETVHVLGDIHKEDLRNREEHGLPVLAKAIITREELNRMESHAQGLRDIDLLKEVLELEKNYEETLPPEQRQTSADLASRAAARQIIAEIDLKERHNNLNTYEKRYEHISVVLETGSDRELLLSLSQTKLKSLGQVLVGTFVESASREAWNNAIENRIDMDRKQMSADIDLAQKFVDFTTSLADQYRQQFNDQQKDVLLPLFTPKELNQIDKYIAGLKDPVEKSHYLKVLEIAETSNSRTEAHKDISVNEPELDISGYEFIDDEMEHEILERDNIDREIEMHTYNHQLDLDVKHENPATNRQSTSEFDQHQQYPTKAARQQPDKDFSR
jgi:hypothetical protein